MFVVLRHCRAALTNLPVHRLGSGFGSSSMEKRGPTLSSARCDLGLRTEFGVGERIGLEEEEDRQPDKSAGVDIGWRHRRLKRCGGARQI